jgi:ATP-dependent Clp protease adaptor protein ClpS
MPRRMPEDIEGQVVIKVLVKEALQMPKKYQVILYNDDYTPMAFVVMVIQKFFHVTEDIAIQLMTEVHQKGRAVCGTFTHDLAETIVESVNRYARLNEYPLLCMMEAV